VYAPEQRLGFALLTNAEEVGSALLHAVTDIVLEHLLR